MSIREIQADDWQEFLDEFSRAHRGWRASVDRQGSAPPRPEEPIERPLQSITPQASDRQIVNIEIRFQDAADEAAALRIDAPRIVRVDESRPGTAQGLEIVDASGGCTRIRFRAAPPPDMLDGIAPGELADS